MNALTDVGPAEPVTARVTPLLQVKNLTTNYYRDGRPIHAVDDVSFTLGERETLGLIGESGCGKTATALSITRLIPKKMGRVVAGQVLFRGRDLMTMTPSELNAVRGREISMIFQDPLASLNPTLSIGQQVMEPMRLHLRLSRRQARARAEELLAKVGIPHARDRMDDYPHHFSGGMRQRVMIAIALSCDPALILADEPTTALDVTLQVQILELIRSLADEFGTALLLISHDLGVAATVCDHINVMYAGQIVESAPTAQFFERQQSPYAWGLLKSAPRVSDPPHERLHAIRGLPPDLGQKLRGCRFAPRCEWARDVCRAEEPALTARSADHEARCFGTEEGGWID